MFKSFGKLHAFFFFLNVPSLMGGHHGIVGVGRDIWRSFSRAPYRRASRQVLKISREGTSPPLHQPVPALCHPHSKEVLPYVHMEIAVLQSVPVTWI